MEQLLVSIDILGTLVFAISGALSAFDRKMDLFGIWIIAFVTALGGGTIRDLLIGSVPVGWMQNIDYLLVVLGGMVLALLFRRVVLRLHQTLLFFDAIGIGLFTIMGLQKTMSMGLSPVVGVMMGTVSAVFGGVIRDLLTSQVPHILRKEVYATACAAGACLYLLLSYLEVPQQWATVGSIVFITVLRLVAVWRKWQLTVPAALHTAENIKNTRQR